MGWTAEDWVALVALSSACYLGSGMLMQVRCTALWRGMPLSRPAEGCTAGCLSAAVQAACMQPPALELIHTVPHTLRPRLQVCVRKLGAPTGEHAAAPRRRALLPPDHTAICHALTAPPATLHPATPPLLLPPPAASMFFGLRLVFAVVLSTPILGSTIIETGLQIAGVVVTACAVTAYAASQWWASRATKEAAATEEEADEEAGTEEESASEGRVPG